jgi:hypothetical protein
MLLTWPFLARFNVFGLRMGSNKTFGSRREDAEVEGIRNSARSTPRDAVARHEVMGHNVVESKSASLASVDTHVRFASEKYTSE